MTSQPEPQNNLGPCHCPWLTTRIESEDPITEDSTRFGLRAWRSCTGTHWDASSLLASLPSAEDAVQATGGRGEKSETLQNFSQCFELCYWTSSQQGFDL